MASFNVCQIPSFGLSIVDEEREESWGFSSITKGLSLSYDVLNRVKDRDKRHKKHILKRCLNELEI